MYRFTYKSRYHRAPPMPSSTLRPAYLGLVSHPTICHPTVFPATNTLSYLRLSFSLAELTETMANLKAAFVKGYWTFSILGMLWAAFIGALLNPSVQR